jgi:hypothetical protein
MEAADANPRLETVQRYAEAVGLRITVVSAGPSLASTAHDMRDAVAAGNADEALRYVIQFLSDVEKLSPEGLRQAVHEEPDSVGDKRWDALLAGVAEHACHHAGVTVPGWSAAPSRFLQRFWFVIEDILKRPAPGLAAWAFARSPAALAARGVFIDRRSLVSV